jgi:lipoyl(octanoyl) transferase
MVDGQWSIIMKWRYIPPAISDAYLNMAKDEFLQEELSRNATLPVLRFYGWNPPGLSIGYFQKIKAGVNLEACREFKVDVVRRPTGGRAILHEYEVTYCVVMPYNQGEEGSVLNTYKAINYGLLQGLKKLGVKAELIPKTNAAAPGASKSFACFTSPSWYEVQVKDKKILGSAQCRKNHTLMQHGSLMLKIDLKKLFACLNTSKIDLQDLKDAYKYMTSLEEVLSTPASFENTVEALKTGFFEAMGEYLEEDFSPAELDSIKVLANNKYRSEDWNLMR